MTLTTSAMWVFKSIPARSRCDRSPSPVSVGVKTVWPPPRSRSATRCQHQPPCQAPWTRTKAQAMKSASPVPSDISGTCLETAVPGLVDHLQQGAQHLGDAVAADGRDHEWRLFRRTLEPRDFFFYFVGPQGIAF